MAVYRQLLTHTLAAHLCSNCHCPISETQTVDILADGNNTSDAISVNINTPYHAQNMPKMRLRRGSAPGPLGESSQRSPRPLAGFAEARKGRNRGEKQEGKGRGEKGEEGEGREKERSDRGGGW